MATKPLEEGRVRKGGRNEPLKDFVRPPPPGAMAGRMVALESTLRLLAMLAKNAQACEPEIARDLLKTMEELAAAAVKERE